MTVLHPDLTDRALDAVFVERENQDAKWGEQNHPDGTGGVIRQMLVSSARDACEKGVENGTLTWFDILREEVYEAGAETDRRKLRAELVQVAAVAVNWIEQLDRRPVEVADDEGDEVPVPDNPAAGDRIDTERANQLPAGSVILIDTHELRASGWTLATPYPYPLTRTEGGWRLGPDDRYDSIELRRKWIVLHIPTDDQ